MSSGTIRSKAILVSLRQACRSRPHPRRRLADHTRRRPVTLPLNGVVAPKPLHKGRRSLHCHGQVRASERLLV
jgi:hypothetical protein